MLLQPVILSGGSGSRLWPLSRNNYPKQFLALFQEQTMLQETILRVQGFCNPILESVLPPIVVVNEEHRFITAEQIHALGISKPQLILEPAGRNTAPALTLAALAAQNNNDDPILLVMPADHIIANPIAFMDAIGASLHAANEENVIVTFGITPTGPEIGYGYIRAQSTPLATTAVAIAAFVEKPDRETAQRYIETGNYLWNSGIFLMRASVWLKAIAYFNPAIDQACQKSYIGATHDEDFIRAEREAFLSCPVDSIDYAVMENLSSAPDFNVCGRVIALDAGWSDVGAWNAVWQIAPKDASGNAVLGDVLFEQSKNCLAVAESRLVVCLGLENIVVIETPDAILVVDQSKTQEIKKIIKRLNKVNRKECAAHRKIFRPWGWYDSVDNGDRFKVKRIVVNPGASLSLQMHHHRAEHWIIVSGTAKITRNDETFLLGENQSTYIPLGAIHRLVNPGLIPLEMIEVQSGSYLGEDDIVRLEDMYGRTN